MSTGGVISLPCRNKIVLEYVQSGKSIDELLALLFQDGTVGKKIKNKPSKNSLAILREMSMFLYPRMPFNLDLVSNLLAMIRDCTDADIDRKVFRYCLHIIFEYINNSITYLPPQIKLMNELYSVINDEIREQSSGVRLCLAWKCLGRGLSDIHSKGSTTANKNDRRINVMRLSCEALSIMTYPDKPNKSMLGINNKKNERDYESQLQLWACILSTMRRTYQALPCTALGAVSCHNQMKAALISGLSGSVAGSISCYEMIRTHAIHVLLQSIEYHCPVKGGCSSYDLECFEDYIHLLQYYCKHLKGLRSGIGSKSVGGTAATAQSQSHDDVVVYAGILRCISIISDRSSIADDVVLDIYQSIWHLIAGIVSPMALSHQSAHQSAQNSDDSQMSQLNLESTKILVDSIRYFLEHRRWSLVLSHVGSTSNFSSSGTSSTSSSPSKPSNAIAHANKSRLVNIFVISLTQRIAKTTDVMMKSRVQGSNSNNGVNASGSSSVGDFLLILPMLLRAVARLGKLILRLHIDPLTPDAMNPLRNIVYKILSNHAALSPSRHMYTLAFDAMIWISPGLIHPMEIEVVQEVKAGNVKASRSSIKALNASASTQEKIYTTKTLRLSDIVKEVIEDQAFDTNLRHQIISHIISRTFGIFIEDSQIQSTDSIDRNVNPNSMIACMDLIMDCFMRYPSSRLMSLICDIWMTIITIIHHHILSTQEANKSINKEERSASLISMSSLDSFLMMTNGMSMDQMNGSSSRNDQDLLIKLRKYLFKSLVSVQSMDMSHYQANQSMDPSQGLQAIRELQDRAIWYLTDEVCLWLRDDLEEFSVPTKQRAAVTHISSTITSLSPPARSGVAISNITNLLQDLSNDTKTSLIDKAMSHDGNRSDDIRGFLVTNIKPINRTGRKASSALPLPVSGRIPRHIGSILVLLSQGLRESSLSSNIHGSVLLQGLIRITARCCEEASQSTVATDLRDYCIEILDSFLTKRSKSRISSHGGLRSASSKNLMSDIQTALTVFKQMQSHSITTLDASMIQLFAPKRYWKTSSIRYHLANDCDKDSELFDAVVAFESPSKPSRQEDETISLFPLIDLPYDHETIVLKQGSKGSKTGEMARIAGTPIRKALSSSIDLLDSPRTNKTSMPSLFESNSLQFDVTDDLLHFDSSVKISSESNGPSNASMSGTMKPSDLLTLSPSIPSASPFPSMKSMYLSSIPTDESNQVPGNHMDHKDSMDMFEMNYRKFSLELEATSVGISDPIISQNDITNQVFPSSDPFAQEDAFHESMTTFQASKDASEGIYIDPFAQNINDVFPNDSSTHLIALSIDLSDRKVSIPETAANRKGDDAFGLGLNSIASSPFAFDPFFANKDNVSPSDPFQSSNTSIPRPRDAFDSIDSFGSDPFASAASHRDFTASQETPSFVVSDNPFDMFLRVSQENPSNGSHSNRSVQEQQDHSAWAVQANQSFNSLPTKYVEKNGFDMFDDFQMNS